MGVGRDEIREWRIDGWVFRKKTVKGNQYITRHKGKQERSLGKFDERLWRLVEDTTLELSEFERRRDAEKVIEKLVEHLRIRQMSQTCLHILDYF